MKNPLIPLALLFPALSALPLAAQAPLYDHFGPQGSQMGAAIAGLGDVDGDGFHDYAVGAPKADGLQPSSGVLYVFSVANPSTLWTFQGERAGDRLGASVAALGDIDGDGAGDLIVGAPDHEWTGGTDRGAVYVLSGATGAQIWKLGGTGDFDRLGFAVAGPGDVDGDLVPDYAFSVPYEDWGGLQDNGVVWIYSGASHGLIRALQGTQKGSYFGFALDAAGDVNGDSSGELLVGAPGIDGGTLVPYLDAGAGYLYDGKTGSVLHWDTGDLAGDLLGSSVAGGHDLDGNVRLDFAYGAPGADAGGVTDSGQVQVHSGVPPYGELYRLDGSATGDAYGHALDLGSDSDGDGLGDVLVGAPGYDSPGLVDAGRVYVYNGQVGGLRYEMGGRVAGDAMGSAVASLGLLNNDPWADFMGGSPLADHATLGVDAGWGRIHLGYAPLPVKYCVAKTNSAGCVPTIGFGGSPTVSIANNFHVGAFNVLPNKPGIMIWSYNAQALPFFGGTLCVQAPVRRTQVQTSTVYNTNPPYPCNGAYTFHFSHTYMAGKGVTPGDEIYCQYWSRDSGFPAPNSVGLTDAMKVTILP